MNKYIQIQGSTINTDYVLVIEPTMVSVAIPVGSKSLHGVRFIWVNGLQREFAFESEEVQIQVIKDLEALNQN